MPSKEFEYSWNPVKETINGQKAERIVWTTKAFDLAVDANIVEKSGAWFAYKGEKLGQGKENVKILLKENKELANEIEKQTREYYGISLNKDKK